MPAGTAPYPSFTFSRGWALIAVKEFLEEIGNGIQGYKQALANAPSPVAAAYQQARINALSGLNPSPGTFIEFAKTWTGGN